MKFIATCTLMIFFSMTSLAADERRTNACDTINKKLDLLGKDCEKMTGGISNIDSCKEIAEGCTKAIGSSSLTDAMADPEKVKQCLPLAKLSLSQLEKKQEELKEKAEKLDKRKKEISDEVEKLAKEKRQAKKDAREEKRDERKDIREQQKDYAEKIRDAKEDMQKAVTESQEKIAELSKESNTQLGEIQGQMNEIQKTSAEKDIEVEKLKMGYIDACDTESTKFLQAIMEKRKKREEQGFLNSNNINTVLGRGRSLQAIKDSYFHDCINSASFSRKMQFLHKSKVDTINSSRTALQSLQERMQQVQQDQQNSASAMQNSAMQQMQAKQKEIAQLNKDMADLSSDLDDEEDEEEEAEAIEKRIEAKGKEHDAIVKQQRNLESEMEKNSKGLDEVKRIALAAKGNDEIDISVIRTISSAINKLNREAQSAGCGLVTSGDSTPTDTDSPAAAETDAAARAAAERERAARERTPAETAPAMIPAASAVGRPAGAR